jgi:TonB-linked SusC/RagA family outer membrane protein
MKRTLFVALMGVFCAATQALAQQPMTVTGRVTGVEGAPLSDVQVTVAGTTTRTMTNAGGNYSIRAASGQVLQFRRIGTVPAERTVGADSVINVTLQTAAANLDAVVVTALGQTAVKRSLGTSQQTVSGVAVVQSQRVNFVNALQGRVAGLNVASTSGVPGASSTITLRGISSISSSNQPLIILDGLPLDNSTLSTAAFASDRPTSNTAFSNRGVDFTNRASDINPEDIASITVLKGPEASALYGIDAANGAIIITTKRGVAGAGGFEYSNAFEVASIRDAPEVQRTYGLTDVDGGFEYFGAPYPAGTQFHDNIDGFFQTAISQKHNLAFSGAAPDNKINYRVATSLTNQRGVVPNSEYRRVNLTGASQAQVTNWLNADLSLNYSSDNNDQPLKGGGSALIGLLAWPQTDDAEDYLTPAGTRRRLTELSASSELDNPYFNVNKNQNNGKTNRILANLGLTLTPFSWGNLKSNIGVDNFTGQYLIDRDPQSAAGFSQNGIIDLANNVTRNLSAQTVLNVNSRPLMGGLSLGGLVGHAIQDQKSTVDALTGQDFLDPNFVSINNTNLRFNQTTTTQRRLVSLFGQATVDYNKYLYLTLTGRNDWTSTIPTERNSFFYPSASASFIFSDAFPSIGRVMTGKLRAAYAEVGRDARPYAYRPALEFKSTAYGGYGYSFWGPNLALKPEFARSYEFGTELGFLDDRLGIDATIYRKQTKDQIVNDIRGSYATGFILFNMNGADTRNEGVEVTLRATPVQRPDLTWDILANFDHHHGEVSSLPRDLPESYVSDTWLYGNVRAGVKPGLSTESLTGKFYLRNDAGQLLIDPGSGLPLRSADFIDAGYDRTPKFTIGLSNTVRYKSVSVSALLDIRRGGDVFNATEHYLVSNGLSVSTLDREQPRVIEGVLRDGRENSANPTANTIVVVPAVQPEYYTGMSEELFIEKDINWVRLRDVTVTYDMPPSLIRNASVFFTATDLFMSTNYTGLDPVVNGNTAAVGGSGATGVDYGNFPMPRGYHMGVRVRF